MRDPQTQSILEEEECLEIVRKKLNRESLSNYEIISHKIVPLPTVNGFMGQYFNLQATVSGSDSNDTIKMNFFTKLPPKAGTPQDEFNREMGCFDKEFNLYKSVFPRIIDGTTNGLFVPECYLALEDTVIVLEDMGQQGFMMTNKYEPFDYEHCAVLMKALGEFHAKSFIFEAKEKRSLYDEFHYCMNETLWPLDKPKAIKMFHATVKALTSVVDLLMGENQSRKFKESLTSLSAGHAKKLRPSKKYKNVLCHGDLWANNILFKYNSLGKPIACCLIDFQFSRYNPPAHDILSFLQFSTVSNLRAQRLNELLHVYHESLTDCLVESGLDADSIFPWQELVNSVRDMRLLCMMHGVLNTPIMLLSEEAAKINSENDKLEEVFYSDRSPLVCSQFVNVPAYRERMRDSLLELQECIFFK